MKKLDNTVTANLLTSLSLLKRDQSLLIESNDKFLTINGHSFNMNIFPIYDEINSFLLSTAKQINIAKNQLSEIELLIKRKITSNVNLF